MARILIVDDKEENLSLLEDILTAREHTVVAARNGENALQEARGCPPDLAISDILMPVMDGFTLCREWRQDSLLKSKPFVFLTATYTDPKDEEFALGLGADRFLLKPVEPDILTACIDDLLKQYQEGAPSTESSADVPPLVFLRQYNETLIRKLEDKLADTEKAYRELTIHREHLEELVDDRTAELKKANEELLKLQELKEDLTNLIVHDMRSPLTVIVGELDMAMIQTNLPDPVRKNLKNALESTRRLIEMTGTLLDLGRMEAGKMRLNLGEHNVLDLVSAAVQAVAPVARTKDIQVSITGSPVVCRCDAGLIARLIFNLLDNGIKFSPKSGRVELQVSKDKDSVLTSVSDSGPGIPEGCRDRIFEKFFQVEARELGCSRSSGLGLAMCKMAVEIHHGRIGVESRPGAGARFWFTLPL